LKFEAVHIHSAPEILVEQIVKQVKSGQLGPGERMPSQRELARRFEVGLGTVRECIKTLNAMGYLEVVRGKGTYIAQQIPPPNQGDSLFHKALEAVSLAELMKAREILECGAARVAAEDADPESLLRLKEVMETLRKNAKNHEGFYPVDFDFHIALAEATGNTIIAETVRLLVDKAHHYIEFMGRSLKTFEPFNIERAIFTAQKVIDAVTQGNGEQAASAMHEHLNIISYELEKEFLAHGGPPLHAGENLEEGGTPCSPKAFTGKTSG